MSQNSYIPSYKFSNLEKNVCFLKNICFFVVKINPNCITIVSKQMEAKLK